MRKIRVLVIKSKAYNKGRIIGCLKFHNIDDYEKIEAEIVDNGKEAMDRAAKNHYDIFFIDILLPNAPKATALSKAYSKNEDIIELYAMSN